MTHPGMFPEAIPRTAIVEKHHRKTSYHLLGQDSIAHDLNLIKKEIYAFTCERVLFLKTPCYRQVSFLFKVFWISQVAKWPMFL